MQIIPEAEKYRPLYVILGRPSTDNAWQGYIENSFSMDWSKDYVRIWWSGKAYSILGEHNIDGKLDAEFSLKEIIKRGWELAIFDLSADDCPIEIDLEQWLKDMSEGQRRKFANRNPKFTMKADDYAATDTLPGMFNQTKMDSNKD